MHRTSLAIASMCLILPLPGCDRPLPGADDVKPADAVVRRDGQPDMIRVADDDPEMHQAIAEARRTVATIIAALKAPKPTQQAFAVKKPFREGDVVEHIWLSDISFDGTTFKGRVDNEPVDVKNVKAGATATVAPGEIDDWFFVEDGKLVGGTSLRLLHQRMSPAEKKDFEANIGFKL